MTADDTRALDLGAIRARAEAATEGPWEAGYLFGHAGVIFNRFGVIVGSGHADATRCALCVLGGPVWTGEMNINGERMPAHRHRELSPHNPEHLINSAATGRLVAGNFATEQGGIVSQADTAFVMHARADIPALLDEVDRLRSEHEARRGSDVEAWIKRARDTILPTEPAFYTIDCLLDDYRDHADTGTPLSEAVAGPGDE